MSNSKGDCCECSRSVSVSQTLEEMDFERGIWHAAQYGDLDKVKKFLDVSRPDPDVREAAGYTALHYAARNGHLDVCRCLIEKGADVDAVTRSGEATALARASSAGHENIVEYLILKKANGFMQDSDGKTALHRAVENGHRRIRDVLLKHFPSLKDVADKKGNKVTLGN